MKEDKIYDIVGIGIGPFNLGLAALSQPISNLSTLFLDQADAFNWHPGMMLSDATLQVPFMADLVTMADPTSPYSFLNYLKQNGRLYKFYIRENFFLLRKEYNAYCKWVINQLPNCVFKQKVTSAVYQNGLYHLWVSHTQSGEKLQIKAKKLVLGTGTQPKLPAFIHPLTHKAVIHSSAYLNFRAEILAKGDVTLVGSGQSAAEIFYDLLPETANGLKLNWFTRPDRFFPMEYAKLTLELTSPEYVDYFFNLSEEKRKQVLGKQNQLFKGINFDLINQIFDKLYELTVDGEHIDVKISPNCQLNNITQKSLGRYQLNFTQVAQEVNFNIETDFVVMCTGYQYQAPDFVKGLENRIRKTKNNQYDVNRQYAIDVNGDEIFVQNAELHTHGFVTPDLGMGAYRNAYILNTIVGKTVYPIEKRIAFQQFDWLNNQAQSANNQPEILNSTTF